MKQNKEFLFDYDVDFVLFSIIACEQDLIDLKSMLLNFLHL